MGGGAVEEVDRFRWVTGHLGVAATVTMVWGRDVPALGEAFGARLDLGRMLPLSDVREVFGGTRTVAFKVMPFGVLGVEINGYQGGDPVVMARASAGSAAVSVYWNDDFCNPSLAYAVDGLAYVHGEFGLHGTYPGFVDEVGTGLPGWGEVPAVARMFALVQRLTGLPAEPAWLDGAFLVMPLAEEIEERRAGLAARAEPSLYTDDEDPGVAQVLRTADEPVLRAFAREAAAQACAHAGLSVEPAVIGALAALPGRSAELDRWADEAAELSAATPDGDPAAVAHLHRALALAAVQEAAHPDARSAALLALQTALRIFSPSPDPLWTAVRAVLGNPAPPSGSAGVTFEPEAGPVARFGWIDRHWLGPACAIVLVRTDDLAAVARAYGAVLDPDRDPGLTLAERPPPTPPDGAAGAVFVWTMPPQDVRAERARTFGPDPGPLPSGFEVEAMGLLRVGEWVVAVKELPRSPDLRPRARYEAPLAALSVGGEAVCLMWESPHHEPRLWSFVDGRERSASPVPGERAALLALAENLTGVVLAPELLDAMRLVVQVDPWN